METPPQACGRRERQRDARSGSRNTPTGVGKTASGWWPRRDSRKHPHRRGEDLRFTKAAGIVVETPPQAWGRPGHSAAQRLRPRNTPTGVGKTAGRRLPRSEAQKHPHRRGEDASVSCIPTAAPETPPQAWGRRQARSDPTGPVGNTPTGVGKTHSGGFSRSSSRKHPHRCGEDESATTAPFMVWETPPQAWGRLLKAAPFALFVRNTPTGVGKIRATSTRYTSAWKHPHRRGEDKVVTDDSGRKLETPPQAWGRPVRRNHRRRKAGNTPTGVGKTDLIEAAANAKEKHPHRRGEDRATRCASISAKETPPQAWGRLPAKHCLRPLGGNTPTGVGKTGFKAFNRGESEKHPHRRGEDLAMLTQTLFKPETPPQAWGRLQEIVKEPPTNHNLRDLLGLQGFDNQLQAGQPGKRLFGRADGLDFVAGRSC